MKVRSSSASPLPAFWVGVGVLTIYVLLKGLGTPIALLATGFLLSACALLPVYLWCARMAPGLPIFPLMSLTYVWTFVLPLMTQPSSVADYRVPAQVQAGLTAVLFLSLATLIWWWVVRSPSAPPQVFLALREDVTATLFLIGLAASCLVQIALQGQWLTIPWRLSSVVLAAASAVSTLAVIVLANRWGRRRLIARERFLFLALLLTSLVVSTASLLQVGAMAMVFVTLVGFTLGRGKPPLLVGALSLAVFAFLQIGKGPIREAYWGAGERAVNLIDYPTLYFRWFGYSLEALPSLLQPQTERRSATLEERSSLIQMTLLVQSKTPDQVPYLKGQTYAIIPGLLVPRFLDSNKLRSHEGTYMLAVDYGLQTQEATQRTTIGFGLLSESYANFGYTGIIALAILIGGGCGFVNRWSRRMPLTSLRGLAAMLVLTVSIQSEYTAGVLITSLFQSAVVLLAAALLLMRPHALRTVAPPRGPALPAPT